jgi:hypothetical protein
VGMKSAESLIVSVLKRFQKLNPVSTLISNPAKRVNIGSREDRTMLEDDRSLVLSNLL